jgi:hypothetical protein
LSKAIRDEVCRRLATLGLRCAHPRSAFDLVATGLDPVVRAAMTQQSRSSTCEPLLSMGCRVKSGNDDIRDQTIPATPRPHFMRRRVLALFIARSLRVRPEGGPAQCLGSAKSGIAVQA